jgi:hypothetical protein
MSSFTCKQSTFYTRSSTNYIVLVTIDTYSNLREKLKPFMMTTWHEEKWLPKLLSIDREPKRTIGLINHLLLATSNTLKGLEGPATRFIEQEMMLTKELFQLFIASEEHAKKAWDEVVNDKDLIKLFRV